jgi:hypothetical protein
LRQAANDLALLFAVPGPQLHAGSTSQDACFIANVSEHDPPNRPTSLRLERAVPARVLVYAQIVFAAWPRMHRRVTSDNAVAGTTGHSPKYKHQRNRPREPLIRQQRHVPSILRTNEAAR